MALLLPAELSGPINEREAIRDSIFRAVLSFDHADEALLRSAVTEDINAVMPGSEAKGIDQSRSLFGTVSPSLALPISSPMCEWTSRTTAMLGWALRHWLSTFDLAKASSQVTNSPQEDCTCAMWSRLASCGSSRLGMPALPGWRATPRSWLESKVGLCRTFRPSLQGLWIYYKCMKRVESNVSLQNKNGGGFGHNCLHLVTRINGKYQINN